MAPVPGSHGRTSRLRSRRLPSTQCTDPPRKVWQGSANRTFSAWTSSIGRALPALVLRLARFAELRVCPVCEQQIRALLVVKDTAQAIAVAGCGEPGRDTCLADGVHVRAFLDEQRKERVPAAVGGPIECVLAGSRGASCVRAQVEQEPDGAERLLLCDRALADSAVEAGR